jgi:hypothetical protein
MDRELDGVVTAKSRCFYQSSLIIVVFIFISMRSGKGYQFGSKIPAGSMGVDIMFLINEKIQQNVGLVTQRYLLLLYSSKPYCMGEKGAD